MKKGFTNKKFSSAVEGVEPLTGRFLYGLAPLGFDPHQQKYRTPKWVSGILESMNSFDAENDLFHIAYINAPEKAANIISKIGESFFLAKCL